MRINNIHRVIIGTAVIGIALFVATKTNHHTEAQVSTTCQTFVLAVPPTVPAGNVSINLTNSTASVVAVQDVVFKIDGLTLGRGVQAGTNPQWQMIWYTQYSTPGNHMIGAEVIFADGNMCPINPVPTSLTGTVIPGILINAASTPGSFQGLTNQVINFGLKATISTTSNMTSAVDVSQYTYFANKTASLGSITPLDGAPVLRFSTGPVAGTGNISAMAFYGGLPGRMITIPVTILAQATTTTTNQTVSPTPAPATSTSTTTTTTTDSTAPQTTSTTSATTEAAIAAASTASVEAEKPLKDCVMTKLGDVRYKVISTGTSRPTTAEFLSINDCFALRNFVLPSGFVPVSPTKVKEQPVSNDVAVNKTENVTAGSTVKLSFKGKAKPNSVVLLYVYSEPLVLSTTADSNGDWSYALEDPLQPGNHEAYAVVDKGDGTYQRSSVFDFAIAKASASAANPNGYSLKLSSIQATAKDDNKLNVIYLGGIGILTLGMLGAVIFGITRLRRSKKNNPDAASNPIAMQPAAPQEAAPQPPVTPAAAEPIAAPEPTIAPQPVPQPLQPQQPTVLPESAPIANLPEIEQPIPGTTDHES